MTPLERADKVRERMINAEGLPERREMLPPGSLILTPDEAETVRQVLSETFYCPHCMGHVSGRDFPLGLGHEALALLAGKGQT